MRNGRGGGARWGRVRPAAFLTLLFATAGACAQPFPSPDSSRSLVARSQAAGLLSDSSAAALTACLGRGVPLTRAAVVRAVWIDVARRSGGVGGPLPIPNRMAVYTPDTAATVPPVQWADSLRAAGLIDAADVRAVRALGGEYLGAMSQTRGLPVEASVAQFQVVAPLLALRERTSAPWLAVDADRWVGAGLMTGAGRDRLLADARAGRLRLPHDALAYVDAVAVTDVEVADRWRVGGTSLDSLRALAETAAGLLRRRGVADLVLTGFAVDSVRRYEYNPYGIEPEYVYSDGTAAVLAVDVDGEPYRQRVGYGPAPLDLLNRVLRDRGSVHRLFYALVPTEGFETSRLAVAALTVHERRALTGDSQRYLTPAGREVVVAYRALPDGSPCRDLAWRALDAAGFDVDLTGPELSSDEMLLTTGRVRQALDGMGAAGLLDHLPPGVRSAVRDGVLDRSLREPDDILEAVPDLVVAFDGENAYPPRPYAALVGRFAVVSRGAFAPTDVVDTFSYEADSVDVAFTSSGRRYAARLGVRSDWLDFDFLDLIAEATAGGAGRFYRLGPYSEDGYAYLTDAQRLALNRLRLLPVGTVPLDEVVRE